MLVVYEQVSSYLEANGL